MPQYEKRLTARPQRKIRVVNPSDIAHPITRQILLSIVEKSPLGSKWPDRDSERYGLVSIVSSGRSRDDLLFPGLSLS